MERINFGYSLKNIPIPSMEAYRKSLARQAGNLMQKMRWAATFFDSPSVTSSKPTYGFASENNPKPHPALTAFETDVYHLCGSVEITTQRSPFQKKTIRRYQSNTRFPNGLHRRRQNHERIQNAPR